MYSKITKCRICGNENLVNVLKLGEQSLTGIFPSAKDMHVTKGPLELSKCMGDTSCGLVQLSHSYDLNELYGQNYGYRSGLNASMVRHLEGKVKKIMSLVKLSNDDLVIDIGSNDGTTLGFYPEELHRVGVDPSADKFRSYYKDGIELIVDFFSAELVKIKLPTKKQR